MYFICSLVEKLEAMGVPIRQITMSSRFDRKAAKGLAKLCEEWDIDLIHCHYLRENYIAMLAKSHNKKIKVVYTNHFVIPNDMVTRLSNRLLDKRQDQMIAVCNKGKEQLIANGWTGEHIQVVFNAVDPEVWAGDRSESTMRTELGIPEDRFVMFCGSRFAEDKGHKYLLDSIKRLTELSAVPFTLVLGGDGPLLEPAKEHAKELGLTEEQVKFMGFRKDIKNLYKGADIYINSSQHEALSYAIIEAMAAGLPVIATDMGGNSDIVNPEAGCGLLVEYDNPDSMPQPCRATTRDRRTKNGADRPELLVPLGACTLDGVAECMAGKRYQPHDAENGEGLFQHGQRKCLLPISVEGWDAAGGMAG